ncbi:hypothetical protein [Lutibacter sp.]|uniref:hypothetical protein n=1 Tax=Lutibacter sp. TaxID=1925666 RepID=UPI0035638A91
MKTYLKFILLVILFTSCDKDDTPKDPIDQLPEATQTGENTIGCLVNGEAFTDSGLMVNFYQKVDGKYNLVINWDDGTNIASRDGQLVLVQIKEIQENYTYILNYSDYADGDFIGGSATFTTNMPDLEGQYETNKNYTGQIYFTRFDSENQIMSGTFSFEAEEILFGGSVSITDGRFDLTFTK